MNHFRIISIYIVIFFILNINLNSLYFEMVNAQDDDGFKTEQIRHMPGHGPRHMMMERMYLDNGTDTQSSPMMAQNTTTLDNQTSFNVSIVLGAISRTTDAYQPNPAYIQSGQAVIWTNNDNFIHTVTHRSMNVDIQSSPPPLFDSGIMDRGQSFAHTFNTEGRYDYYCTIHPWMVGQIYVTSISSSTSDTN
jgi:plastocyanin